MGPMSSASHLSKFSHNPSEKSAFNLNKVPVSIQGFTLKHLRQQMMAKEKDKDELEEQNTEAGLKLKQLKAEIFGGRQNINNDGGSD